MNDLLSKVLDMNLTSMKYPVPTKLATEVITAAWMTYSKLGATKRSHREIVNEPLHQELVSTDGFLEQGEVLVPALYRTVVTNILHMLQPLQCNPDIKLEITDAVRAQAEADVELVSQTALFRVLQDDIDGFMRDIGNCLKGAEVTMGDIKRMCYITTIADQLRIMHAAEDLLTHAKDEYLAPVDHTAKVTATILAVRYSKDWNTYDHKAITDEGHVISFFFKKPQDFASKVTIEGRIKAHNRMWKRPEIAETRMNYVRKIDG